MGEEEEDEPRQRKKRGRGKAFLGLLTFTRVAALAVFIIGILAGYYLAANFIDAPALQKCGSDYNALQEKYTTLDSKADSYYTCLNKLSIYAETCEPGPQGACLDCNESGIGAESCGEVGG